MAHPSLGAWGPSSSILGRRVGGSGVRVDGGSYRTQCAFVQAFSDRRLDGLTMNSKGGWKLEPKGKTGEFS